MYIEYFRLNERPFSLTPDPRFLFMSDRHREGLAHLLYGVQQSGGFVQLTGEIGSGKTTLSRCLTSQLPPETDIALILNPRLTVSELLAAICDELGIAYPSQTDSIKVLTDALNQHLLSTHGRGRRTVLLIDEAQNLHIDVLEQVRLLTNLESSKEKLLQVILIGQPELIAILDRDNLRQLKQRITARYHLRPLSRNETSAYIEHRLLIAGSRDPIFTARARRLAHRLSGGIPRLINIICDRALLGAYALDKRKIGCAIVRRAYREVQGGVPRHRRSRLIWTAAAVVLASMAIMAVFVLNPGLLSISRHNLSEDNINVGVDSSAVKSKVIDTPSMDHKTVLARSELRQANDFPNPKMAASAKSEVVPDQRNEGSAESRVYRGSMPEGANAETFTDDAMSSAAPDIDHMHPSLADILADPSLRGDTLSSFTNLFAQWGVKIALSPSDLGCSTARAYGFECFYQKGSWAQLRRLDLPAILEFQLPSGLRHPATLIGLGENTATLAIGVREYVYPLDEIDRLWEGSFILFWKPPFEARQISFGDRGENINWIREALDILEKKASDPDASDLFDESLRHRVVAFQREQSLIQDGVVGRETLMKITQILEGPKAPSVSRYSH